MNSGDVLVFKGVRYELHDAEANRNLMIFKATKKPCTFVGDEVRAYGRVFRVNQVGADFIMIQKKSNWEDERANPPKKEEKAS